MVQFIFLVFVVGGEVIVLLFVIVRIVVLIVVWAGTIILRDDIVTSQVDCVGARDFEEDFFTLSDDKVKRLLVVLSRRC